jgi:hypothetical protein
VNGNPEWKLVMLFMERKATTRRSRGRDCWGSSEEGKEAEQKEGDEKHR